MVALGCCRVVAVVVAAVVVGGGGGGGGDDDAAAATDRGGFSSLKRRHCQTTAIKLFAHYRESFNSNLMDNSSKTPEKLGNVK